MNYVASLLNHVKPISGKFIIKILSGTMRLGVADNTILDALAIAYTGSKENREKIYSLLYQKASDIWVKDKVLSHAIEFHSNDTQSISSFFNNGFGKRCVNSILDINTYTVNELINKNIKLGTIIRFLVEYEN